MRKSLQALLVGIAAALPAFPGSAAEILRFKDREIDLTAHLEGFPYESPFVDLGSGRLFYRRHGKTDELMMQSFDPSSSERIDLSKGRVLSPRDFSKRNLWAAFYSTHTGKVILQADENNEELFNFYALDPETGAETRLSSTSYIYGFARSPDRRRIAYGTRSAKDELSQGDVRVLDLVTGEETVLYRDSPEIKLVWGKPSWRPNGEGLLVPFIASGSRKRYNLLYVPLDPAEQAEVLTDTTTRRNVLRPLNLWLDDDTYLYLSDEGERNGVYRAGLKGGAVRVTPAADNVLAAAMLRDGGRLHLAAVSGDPRSSVLRLLDPGSGAVRHEKAYPGKIYIVDAFEDRLALEAESLDNPFTELEVAVSSAGLREIERTGYPAELLSKVVHCESEKVSFETFDGLTAPGESSGLHAYLLRPKRPRPPREARGLVLAFYGGRNAYSKLFQLLCQAGYHVLSPAPRGSSDFGGAFYDLAAGDWGGGETLDAFAAGKFLARRLGLPADRIGIFGGSRGGYDALRALTFPGEVNGVREEFRFGFGIADFPITNILRATKEGNISQHFAYLTGGDPERDRGKWLERSPETHASRLSGPVLLTHGSSDRRVPVTESRAFYEKLRAGRKEAYYVELQGQGHAYKGVEAFTRYYRAVFDFLGRLP